MGRTKFHRKDILKSLTEIFSDVSRNVFVTNRPESVEDEMKNFIVVSIPSTIYERRAYQDTYCRIEVFARNRKNGMEATDVLDTMQQAVIDKFPLSNKLFSAISPRLLPGGNDGLGFHCVIIQAKMTIK